MGSSPIRGTMGIKEDRQKIIDFAEELGYTLLGCCNHCYDWVMEPIPKGEPVDEWDFE